ncbi:NUDIX hydrolase [Polaribacter sargassicola]|uniref:NUDIX hydrolase n=1 Tax=Polaribacter sargassicola TaxID=2836891 RepID=UPI001F1F6171|nr:CoA pyrophosphatase [Polaribacter sp. DS7-9]MCG1036951.1 CoA pyrophosphatase [Polaribacter sp. DS7-9]
MSFKKFQLKIDKLKKEELGGLEAQFKMAPKLRLKYNDEQIAKNNPRKAAVLALIYPNKNKEACILLTKRASYNGKHSSQISFPGGKLDVLDKSLKNTALRETYEEVGVLESSVNLVRELTDVYIPPSNFLVSPFLGFVNQRPNFNLNYEVDTIIEVLLSDLLSDTSLSSVKMNTSYMKNIEVPCFKLNDYVVWGATAMMLSEIKELLKE